MAGAFAEGAAGLVAAVAGLLLAAGLVFAAAAGLLFEAGEVCPIARLARVTHDKATSARVTVLG